MATILLALMCFMCLSIGVKGMITQEVTIGAGKVWKGKGTFLLTVPLTVCGLLVAASLFVMLFRPFG